MLINTHSDWKKKLRNSHIKSDAVAGFQGEDSVGGRPDTDGNLMQEAHGYPTDLHHVEPEHGESESETLSPRSVQSNSWSHVGNRSHECLHAKKTQPIAMTASNWDPVQGGFSGKPLAGLGTSPSPNQLRWFKR